MTDKTEALDLIFRRRSIRKYSDKAVQRDTITLLLKAAMAAPSARATDPWRFMVVDDPGLLKRIAEGLPYGKMLANAPAGIVVCGDIEAANGQELSYLLQDCSAAIENLLLAASALGIGGCWLGVHPNEERIAYIRDLFSLPKKLIPVSAIALGYPDEQPKARTRYREDYVYFNTLDAADGSD